MDDRPISMQQQKRSYGPSDIDELFSTISAPGPAILQPLFDLINSDDSIRIELFDKENEKKNFCTRCHIELKSRGLLAYAGKGLNKEKSETGIRVISKTITSNQQRKYSVFLIHLDRLSDDMRDNLYTKFNIKL